MRPRPQAIPRPPETVPTLICDLRPSAAAWTHEYESLRRAGESLALYWPHAPAAAGMAAVRDAADLDAAFENERIACLNGERLPVWLALDEFHRVLLFSETEPDAALMAAEAVVAEALFAAGCEEIEVISDAAVNDLAQSWHSGRRVGARRLTAPLSGD